MTQYLHIRKLFIISLSSWVSMKIWKDDSVENGQWLIPTLPSVQVYRQRYTHTHTHACKIHANDSLSFRGATWAAHMRHKNRCDNLLYVWRVHRVHRSWKPLKNRDYFLKSSLQVCVIRPLMPQCKKVMSYKSSYQIKRTGDSTQ